MHDDNYIINTWKDGNIIAEKTYIDLRQIDDSELGNESITNFVMTAYENRINFSPLIGAEWIYNGHLNKNLIGLISGKTFYNIPIKISYQYEFDKENCPIKIVETNHLGGELTYTLFY